MYTKMSSLNRHLLDAYFAWYHENGLYQINMLCHYEPLNCPALLPFVQDGMVLLNVSPNAVRNFRYTDTGFSFNMHIKGVPSDVHVPFYAMGNMMLPYDTNTRVPAPFPMLELLMQHDFEQATGAQGQVAPPNEAAVNEPLPDGAFAVRGVHSDRMDVPAASIKIPPSVQKEPTKPLLDFGHYGGDKIPLLTQPKSRFTGKPTLTVIKGGRAN